MPAILNSYSQHVTIANETFSGVPNGWTVTPSSSATWSRDTNYYLSSPSSYKGDVPSSANAGSTVVLTSPVFDLSQYPYVFLRFSHICKVSNVDICQVLIKEDFTGSQWHVIPSSCYLGLAKNYSKDRKFSDASYADWYSDSLLFQPTNSWWKTESFDVSSEASYAPVQFRFVITKGSTVGTEYAAGWFIDNFELIASMNQISPPVVEFLPPLFIDTVYHTGPYTINAKVATRTNSPINSPKLEVRYINGQNTTYDTLLMNNVAGDSMWSVVIPQVLFRTNVKYSINASDTGGNVSFATAEFYVKRLGIDDSNSVAMTSIDYPKDLVVGGQPTPVVVTFTNKGIKDVDSCVLNWSVNGTSQPSHTWRGHIADGHSAQDTIGYYSPRQNTYDTIVVWVGMPNGVIDTIIHDDTVHVYTYGCITILSGEYIVGTDLGANFTSINNVISALGGCGSSGNVTLKLQSGTLVENVSLLNLRSLLGVDDTLIITSQTGKAQDAIIKPTNGSAFTIGKSDNIVIKNITIDVSSATTLVSNGIYFSDSCTNIWIDSCIIKAKNVTDTGYDCIRQSTLPVNTGGVLKNIYITNNTILDGYHGIYLSGRASGNGVKNININICNNTIRSFGIGIKLWGSDFGKINNNYITRNSTVVRWCHGIFFQNAFGKEVCNNRIHLSGVGGAPSTGWNCGGIVGWSGNGPNGFSATDRLLIANNEVIIAASNVTARGIYCSGGPVHTDFVHNSVLMTGTVGSTSDAPMCFYIANGVGAAYRATIYNNNFINLSGISTGTKNHAIRLPATNTSFVRDYNNYYSVGRYPVATTTSYPTIQSWISAFYLDSNSVSVLPDSISTNSTDLIIEGSQILCPALNQIPYDISNNQRVVTTNMGCHHTNIPDMFDAGIAELSFSRAFADSAYPTILVSILNMGSQTLDSVDIKWSVNGVVQPTYKWYGSLNRGQQSQKVNIGNFMVRKGINTIVVYTSSPNGQPLDSDHNNDTAYYQEFACGLPLVGTYTVGGTHTDFIDEKEMMQAIRDCGIGGSVVFEFESGVYGDLNFSNYPLPSVSMDSIIITSSARHADSVVFMSSGAAALSIGEVANFIFEKVTFDATTNGDYAVKFMKPMNNIKFYKCNIFANPTATATDYAGVYYAGLSGNINDISFIKNKITGGYYSFYLKTTGANRFVLDSNELIDAAGAGIYCEEAAHFSSISYNKIK